MATVWIDGELVDERTASVSVFDHGFTVGDGIFETLRVTRGRPFALTRHLVRLRARRAALGYGTGHRPDPRGMPSCPRPPHCRVMPRITYTGGLAHPVPVAAAPRRPGYAGWILAADGRRHRPWPRNSGSAAGSRHVVQRRTSSSPLRRRAWSFGSTHAQHARPTVWRAPWHNVSQGRRPTTPPLSVGLLGRDARAGPRVVRCRGARAAHGGPGHGRRGLPYVIDAQRPASRARGRSRRTAGSRGHHQAHPGSVPGEQQR